MAGIKSNISFGLVNIPVVMMPIVKDNDASFNQLHKKCLNRIRYIKYCPTCNKELKETDIVKGYQYAKDNYLVFEKKELDALKPEKNHEIEVISFININEIPSIYLEKSYYLSAATKSKAYSLFSEALNKTKMVALAKCVISTKFYYCILRLTTDGIIMTTLYFDEEINTPNTQTKGKVEEKELNLAIKLINSMKGKFEPEKYKDEYHINIEKAINTKLKGQKIKDKKKSNKAQVTSLLDALEKSLKE